MSGKKPSREAIAWAEIGTTAISRSLAVALSVFFLAAVFLVPLGQYVFDLRNGTTVSFTLESGAARSPGETFFAAIDRRNTAILESISQLENTLEEESLLRKAFLPPLQYLFLRFFDKGNDKAIPGRDGWLHFAPALDSLVGPPFLDPHQLQTRAEAHKLWEKPIQSDPLAAIIDFKNQLTARGIALIVVPVPVKAAIQPEKISARMVARPLANRSWPLFVRILRESGVRLYDPRPVLSRFAKEHGDAYLPTDTHWSPGAMQAVAEELAGLISTEFPQISGKAALQAQPQTVFGQGDIARMLTLPEKANLYPGREVHIRRILTAQQEFWQPDSNGEILLLGDSFTNIYSIEALGWGVGAGFAEQLSHLLQTPLDLLARNDSGAYVTREMLAGELARGRDRLAGKKLVIWQFAERELALGDWRRLALQLGKPRDKGFFVVPSGEKVKVSGVVAAISRSARPGSVPYRDNLVTLHLLDLQGFDRQLPGDQALVYGWGMRDNQLTRLAAVRPGDSVTVTLTPWEEVEGEFGSYRRTPLDDQMMELELPNWGLLEDDKTH
jgi:SGNH hydrolase-like domain, acetyltransferase AlgX